MAPSIKDLLQQGEFWIFAFALGWVLLNWPMLSLSVGRSTIFSIPVILIYIAAIWLLIILLLYLFDRGHRD